MRQIWEWAKFANGKKYRIDENSNSSRIKPTNSKIANIAKIDNVKLIKVKSEKFSKNLQFWIYFEEN